MLNPAGMVCPRCLVAFAEAPDSCSGCGYDFERACEAFPFSPPPLGLVMDPAGLTPEGLEESIRVPYAKLRAAFPQIDLSFCFVKLAPDTPLNEFAFWLINAAPEATEQRAWHLLVTIDFDSGQISLIPGYAIEPFIEPSDWTANLGAAAMAGSAGNWTEALEIFLHNSERILHCAWEESRNKPAPTGEPS